MGLSGYRFYCLPTVFLRNVVAISLLGWSGFVKLAHIWITSSSAVGSCSDICCQSCLKVISPSVGCNRVCPILHLCCRGCLFEAGVPIVSRVVPVEFLGRPTVRYV